VALATAVEAHGAGHLVLGGKHHTTLGRWLAGSTAHDAVRRLPVPVLVSAGPPTEKRRVLVAVDLSPAAGAAICAARQFVELWRGELRALHAIEPAPVISELPAPVDEREVAALAREHLEREVWPLLPDAAAGRVVREGPVAAAIAREAIEWGADLVVVASHGRRWLGRLLIGSVTERLLGRLPTSLLVVSAPVVAHDTLALPLEAGLRAPPIPPPSPSPA
jgi:nucleotide-binding universal stress UspA family protein